MTDLTVTAKNSEWFIKLLKIIGLFLFQLIFSVTKALLVSASHSQVKPTKKYLMKNKGFLVGKTFLHKVINPDSF